MRVTTHFLISYFTLWLSLILVMRSNLCLSEDLCLCHSHCGNAYLYCTTLNIWFGILATDIFGPTCLIPVYSQWYQREYSSRIFLLKWKFELLLFLIIHCLGLKTNLLEIKFGWRGDLAAHWLRWVERSIPWVQTFAKVAVKDWDRWLRNRHFCPAQIKVHLATVPTCVKITYS